MKKLRIAMIVLFFTSLPAGLFLHREPSVDERAVLREMAPDLAIGGKTGAPPRYVLGNGDAAFNTYDVVPSVRGYAGPIKLMLILGRDGRIKGTRIIEHRETKNYVHYLETPEYLGRFIGKSVADRFEVDRDIDGITRATVSVEALARTVRDSSRIIAASAYGIRVSDADQPDRAGRGWLWYALLIAFGAGGYILTRANKRFLRVRDASLIASLLIVGFWLSCPFSILHVFNLALWRPSSSALWFAVIVATGLSLALAGRFYCGWICPFGAISEFIGRLPVRKWAINGETDVRWRNVKYYVLGGLILIVFLTRTPDYANIETYVTLFSFHGNALTWTLVAVMLLANLRAPRFWCRFLCPVAAFTGLLSRNAKGYPSAPGCPMANKSNPEISECIRCNRCYAPRERGNSPSITDSKVG